MMTSLIQRAAPCALSRATFFDEGRDHDFDLRQPRSKPSDDDVAVFERCDIHVVSHHGRLKRLGVPEVSAALRDRPFPRRKATRERRLLLFTFHFNNRSRGLDPALV